MIFYYVRHGDPTYSPDALTPLGKRQAEAVCRRIALHGVDQIYSSTSTRAYETAAPLGEMLKKPVEKLDWTNESHAWKNLSDQIENGDRRWYVSIPKYKELFHTDEVRALADRWYDHPAFADKPQSREYMLRTEQYIDELFLSFGYRHDRKNHCWECEKPGPERVALFAHGGFGAVFLANVLDIPYPFVVGSTQICHTGMSVISFGNQGKVYPSLLELSGDGHLYADRLPTAYNNGIYI